MPTTIIRRKRSSRVSIGPYRRHELLTGKAHYPALGYTGYGDGEDTNMEHFISEEMRADWIANRAELLAFWESGKYTTEFFPDGKPWLFVRGHPWTLPWAATIFDRDDEPEPRRARKPSIRAARKLTSANRPLRRGQCFNEAAAVTPRKMRR
jgi:hypothetical protein